MTASTISELDRICVGLTWPDTRKLCFPQLPMDLRLPSGEILRGPQPAHVHALCWLTLLHGDHDGLVELAAGRRATVPNDKGKLALDIYTRKFADWYLPVGTLAWQEPIMRRLHTAMTVRREEIFAGVTERTAPGGTKKTCERSSMLWLDVDEPGRVEDMGRLPCPPHMVVESGGSGGIHAYWKLDAPLPALETVHQPDGSTTEIHWIERMNLRLIHRFGGDIVARDRTRVMRIPGSPNWKTGAFSRIVFCDLHRPGVPVTDVVAGMPDAPADHASRWEKTVVPAPQARVRRADGEDWLETLKRDIAPPTYFRDLLRLDVNPGGKVCCPNPAHDDRHPSCQVFPGPGEGWHCYSCGAGGGIVDAAAMAAGLSVWGTALRGETFKVAARQLWATYARLFPTLDEPRGLT
ncbi:hypothetical protein GKE82_23630 [Conexibacter sp. W3-3-2]|uniref:hypothetical protein n=1 Tax=Conexibacter sp. W3-3-2 TaxID=2675227 RepID=UPI0012B706B3|nr:hypothetical protein [Conexibacter sp. W3-3-2]MTD47197.1 hypothetical protein [Conexibacter sp. W3-3-2]